MLRTKEKGVTGSQKYFSVAGCFGADGTFTLAISCEKTLLIKVEACLCLYSEPSGTQCYLEDTFIGRASPSLTLPMEFTEPPASARRMSHNLN